MESGAGATDAWRGSRQLDMAIEGLEERTSSRYTVEVRARDGSLEASTRVWRMGKMDCEAGHGGAAGVRRCSRPKTSQRVEEYYLQSMSVYPRCRSAGGRKGWVVVNVRAGACSWRSVRENDSTR